MTEDTTMETAASPASEKDKKAVPFGSKVLHQTLQGTKHALQKSKNAVRGTVNTVKSTVAVETSAKGLHPRSKKSGSREHTTHMDNGSSSSINLGDAKDPIKDMDIAKKKEALLDEKEALLEEKGALLDELATTPLAKSTNSESKFFPLTEIFGRETTLLHLSLIVVTYPTYKYWETFIRLPLSLVLAWLFVGFSVGNFVSIHLAQHVEHVEHEHMPNDSHTESARRPSFRQGSFQSTNPLLRERSTSSFNSSWRHRSLGFFPSRRDWHATPSFINPLGISASIKRWNCDPTRDHKHRQLMHLLLSNRNLRRKRKLQDKHEKEQTESSIDPGDSSENLKASMALGNYSLSDVDSFGDLENYIIEPSFMLKGMDVFLCEADGGVPETKVADHSWFVQHGLRTTPIFIVNLSTQWGNILLYFSLPEWLKDWESVKENDQDSKEIKALKKFFDGSDQDRNSSLYFMPSVVEAPYAVRCVSPSKQEYLMGDRAYLPLLWTKYPSEPESNKAIAIELEIDCMSSGWVRSMAGLVKRNLVSLSIDVAVLLKTEEAQLCLAMWRFDHIDISSSPTMPARASS